MDAVVTPQGSGAEVRVATESEARDLVDLIKQQGARLIEQAAQLETDKQDFETLVGIAYQQRAWIPLGYESWEELARTEFAGARFFDSISARRERVQALISEGLSTRAIGDVLGISKNTAHRDALATVPSGTVAKPPAPAPRNAKSLDGRERPRRRATDAEHADRLLVVAQRRAEGWSQDDIAKAVGVTQRTISTDDQLIKSWRDDLDEKDLERLQAGKMSRVELAERVNLEIVNRERKRLETSSRNGAGAMVDAMKFLRESVVYADAWLEERPSSTAILAEPLATVAAETGEWMALEFDFEQVPDEQLQLLSDDLGRAAEWAAKARARVLKAAKERSLELETEAFRETIDAKVASRRGRR